MSTDERPRWVCKGILPTVPPCDAHGDNDRDAEKHVKETKHATGPDTGCYITLPNLTPHHHRQSCGEPVVQRGLCAKHHADWVRLGGTG